VFKLRMDGTACLKGVMGRGAYNHWVVVDVRVGHVEPVSIGISERDARLPKPSF